MISVAFSRLRAQLGKVRCAATHSSEADSAHPTPASPAATKTASFWRARAINAYARTTSKFAESVMDSGEKRALSHGTRPRWIETRQSLYGFISEGLADAQSLNCRAVNLAGERQVID